MKLKNKIIISCFVVGGLLITTHNSDFNKVFSAESGYSNGKFYGNDKKLANWWYDDGTEWYFFQDGEKHTGYGTDGNGKRFFANGKYANWWYDDGNDWYFFQDGEKHTGYATDANGKRYFVRGKYANGIYEGKNFVDGVYKNSVKKGYLNGKFYGDDEKLANWWYDDGTAWYFFRNGEKYTGYGTDGNGKKFFANGKYANWWYDDGTAWYFFQEGEKHTGYGTDGNGKRFFHNGKYANWWYDDGNDWYFFQDGEKHTGYATDANGKRYFVRGKYANGIYEGKNFVDGVYKNSVKKGYLDGKFYGDDGRLANWWYDDGTAWYFFQEGEKHTGYGTDGNGKRFFDNGKYANWWHDDGSDWYFFKEGTKHSGYGTDGNGKRFFDNGKYANWWYDDGSDWYFFKEGVKFSGEAKDASGLRKFVNGKYATDGYSFGEWIFKDGKKYLSDGNGGYQKGFARDNNGDLYYFSTFDGSMQVDFLAYDKRSGSYYKVGSDGIAVRTNSPRTDFIKIVAPSMVNAVRGKGLFPSIAIAQTCLETGFGSSTLGYPPVYNLFGIKAPVGAKESDYVSVWTTEYDRNNQPYKIVDKFKKFKNYEEAFSYYANLFTRTAWLTNYYRNVVSAKTPEEAAEALTGTYATDPNYGNKLLEIVEQYNLRQYDKQIYPNGVK